MKAMCLQCTECQGLRPPEGGRKRQGDVFLSGPSERGLANTGPLGRWPWEGPGSPMLWPWTTTCRAWSRQPQERGTAPSTMAPRTPHLSLLILLYSPFPLSVGRTQ